MPTRPQQPTEPSAVAPAPPRDLRDKVVLLTGGARNIGRGTALALAHAGARVIVADRDPMTARSTLAAIQPLREDCDWVRVNITDEDDVAYLVDRVHKLCGRIDVLINNAGAGGVHGKPPQDLPTASFEASVAGNVRQQFLCCRAVLPIMVAQGGGSIIGTSSIQGVVSANNSPLYSAAKAGVINLMRHIANYYGKYGIRANAVCPGHIVHEHNFERYTRIQLARRYPLRRLGHIRDIVETYLYLASSRSSFVTGTAVMVDGGFTCR